MESDSRPRFAMTADWEETAYPDIPELVFSICDFGAIGDGKTLNTDAINQTVQACSDAGGGRVVIPPGIWLTGPIRLLNCIDLHVEQGAIVQFSNLFDEYPLIRTSYEGIRTVRCMSPIYGENLHDIAITGKGVFDGAGEAWRPVKKAKMTENQWKLVTRRGVTDPSGKMWWPTEEAMTGAGKVKQWLREGLQDLEIFQEARDFLRPTLVQLDRCKRVLIEGPTFQNSASWCLHPWLCEHVAIHDINVRNPWYSQNGDGLDLDSCRYVTVTHSNFDVGDDAICIKSGKDDDGRDLGVPCEHILIQHCVVYHGHGGFVIGSEMSGSVRHIKISDCLFIGTDNGLRFKTALGRGGVVEQIDIRNIRMTGIVKEAITFSMYYGHSTQEQSEHRHVDEKTPLFRDFYLDQIVCMGAARALAMTGLPEQPLQRVQFHNMTLKARTGISLSYVQGILFSNLNAAVDSEPLISMHECRDVHVEGERDETGHAIMEVSGTNTANIRITGFEGLESRLAAGVNKEKILLSPRLERGE